MSCTGIKRLPEGVMQAGGSERKVYDTQAIGRSPVHGICTGRNSPSSNVDFGLNL